MMGLANLKLAFWGSSDDPMAIVLDRILVVNYNFIEELCSHCYEVEVRCLHLSHHV